MKLFGAMAGDALMEELAGFFEVFFHLRRGFAERAAAVQARLSDAGTAFVLVTAPDATHLADAAYLRDGLLARGTPITAVVFNRAFHAGPDGAPLTAGATWPDDAMTGPTAHLAAIRKAARTHHARLVDDNETFSFARDEFSAALASRTTRLLLPILDAEPTTLEELGALIDRVTEAQGT